MVILQVFVTRIPSSVISAVLSWQIWPSILVIGFLFHQTAFSMSMLSKYQNSNATYLHTSIHLRWIQVDRYMRSYLECLYRWHQIYNLHCLLHTRRYLRHHRSTLNEIIQFIQKYLNWSKASPASATCEKIHRDSKKLCQLIFCSLFVKYEPILIKIGRSVPE